MFPLSHNGNSLNGLSISPLKCTVFTQRCFGEASGDSEAPVTCQHQRQPSYTLFRPPYHLEWLFSIIYYYYYYYEQFQTQGKVKRVSDKLSCTHGPASVISGALTIPANPVSPGPAPCSWPQPIRKWLPELFHQKTPLPPRKFQARGSSVSGARVKVQIPGQKMLLAGALNHQEMTRTLGAPRQIPGHRPTRTFSLTTAP